MKLYNYYRSSASYRVRIALNLKHLEYEYIPVHLLNNGGEQLLDSYTEKNPMAQVPSLEYDGKTVNQSMAIIQYIDELFPENSLFGNDPYQKAQIIEFCEIINSGIQPLQNLSTTRYLENNLDVSADQKKQWLKVWIEKGLQALENMVTKDSSYFIGDRISAAECFLIPQLFSSRRMGIDLEPYPKLLKFEDTCSEHAAVIKAHPDNHVDSN